jgi:predicted nucleic acid-binding protein
VIVVDTGVLYALADDTDTHHRRCTDWLQDSADELVVPSLVITEAAYLIGSRGGSHVEALFLEALTPSGRFRVGELVPGADLARMGELVRSYDNLPLGTVDAGVIAVAERLNVGLWQRSIAATSRLSGPRTYRSSRSSPS